MSEVAGKDCLIKISGAPVAFVGEVTTVSGGNTAYQITNAAKQVLDLTEPIHVLVKGTDDAAEAGTNTTNIKMTAHGLATGDVIINTTRTNAVREVVRVDADNVDVATVTGQTTSDAIEVYKEPAAGAYSLNRLSGKATFGAATSRTVLISGSYLPMTIAATANKMSRADEATLHETQAFQAAYKKRLVGLKSASGTLAEFDVTDQTFIDALVAGNPIVIEDRSTAVAEPSRTWALLESTQVEAAVDGVQNQTVSWISHDSWLRLGV